MRWNRIVTGGLLAGVVFILFEVAAEPLFASQMEELFARLGLPTPGEGAMIARAVTLLGVGVLTVWLYGSLEPRYGRGKSTAALAGTVVWALTCLFSGAILYSFGIFTAQFFFMTAVYALPQSVVSALAGSWLARRKAAEGSDLAAARA
jgi:hypothetical protein